jgi:eukaryotic-like serine/threonine-protein kinase
MSTRAQTPSPGDVLAGKYRVERVIGEGGMGVVVAATHLQLGQLVALKFATVESGAAAARFLREAKSAVRLRSEHVAKVTDVGTLESGFPYMVMEYLEGQDLSEVLRVRGPLPVSDAVGYVVQACEAVAEAHALGIVHRDLKPHNLFLTTGVTGLPKVKVLDFGISKTMDSELALTRTAEIVGTPMYMSPEQLRSARDVDLRADIWALGVILYELLTGRLPFEAENLPHLCTMVATETPKAPSVHRPDLPPGLSEVVLRCLERAPEARFADAVELVAALAPFAADWSSPHRVQLVPRSSPSGRAVISAPPKRGSATDAAWSETELANPRTPLWARRSARFALLGLTLMGGVALGARAGFKRGQSVGAVPIAPVVASTNSEVPAASSSSPSAGPGAHADPSSSVVAPSSSPTPSTASADSPQPASPSAPRATPLAPKPARPRPATPKPTAAPEQENLYDSRK